MIIVNENLKPETFVKNDIGYGTIDTVLNHIFFGKGYMIASEGHMLLYSRVKMEEGDEYVLISKEQYKAARKASKGHSGIHFVIGDEEISFADESTSPKVNALSRVNLIEFAKMAARLINFAKSRLGGTKSVALVNKEYLRKCMDAFGKDESVKWLFGMTPLDPMIIKPAVDENNAFALLLGMRDETVTNEVQNEYQLAREKFYSKDKAPETKKKKKK